MNNICSHSMFFVFGLAILSGCADTPVPTSGVDHRFVNPTAVDPSIELPSRVPVFQSSANRAEMTLRILDADLIDRSSLSVTTSCNCADAKIVSSSLDRGGAEIRLRLDTLNAGIHHASILLATVDGRKMDSVNFTYEVVNDAKLEFIQRDFGVVAKGTTLMCDCKIVRGENDPRELFVAVSDVYRFNQTSNSPQSTRATSLGSDSFVIITEVGDSPGFAFRKAWIEDSGGRQLTKAEGITWEISTPLSWSPETLTVDEKTLETTAILEFNDPVEELTLAAESEPYWKMLSFDLITKSIGRLKVRFKEKDENMVRADEIRLKCNRTETILPVQWASELSESK